MSNNHLYQAVVICVIAIGYSMLGKKMLKIAPLSIQKFDLEDMGKLVAIVVATEMSIEYPSNRRFYHSTSMSKVALKWLS